MLEYLTFTKMNGAGNDFVMVDNRARHYQLTNDQIARICDRHRGVGADGLIMLEPPGDGADFQMRYYNADGGEVEMCGNGARCFAKFAESTAGKSDQVRFGTPSGIIEAQLVGDLVQLAMGVPHGLRTELQLEVAGQTLDAHFLNTGVPHVVVFVQDVERFPIIEAGRAIRYHQEFQPAGTNANFVQKTGSERLRIRTYERGVENETLACGTGVVASALIDSLLHGSGSPITVRVEGGDDLQVDFARREETFSEVSLTGPAEFVFKGEIAI